MSTSAATDQPATKTAPDMLFPDRIPVFLLSGFLGSGKSTLLNAFLNDPAVRDTAIIINEFGDVPVDHLLVRQGETAIQQVSTGCLCCVGTTNLQQTLSDLKTAADSGRTHGFSRVIVEMSGLGDPAPLVNALTSGTRPDSPLQDADQRAVFYLAGVVTLFDVVAGVNSVEHHFEAVKQIAFADRIVLTKTDLAQDSNPSFDSFTLIQDLRTLNAGAEVFDRCTADLATLFAPRPYATVERGEDVVGWLALESALAQDPGHGAMPGTVNPAARHGTGIRTFSLVRDFPLSGDRLQRFLTLLQGSAGQRLLRVKGIVATADAPNEPMIIHAVQHVLSAPVRLPAWPDADRRTRLVFITDGIDPEPVKELFSAVIDSEPSSFTKFLKSAAGDFVAAFSQAFSTLSRLSRRSK